MQGLLKAALLLAPALALVTALPTKQQDGEDHAPHALITLDFNGKSDDGLIQETTLELDVLESASPCDYGNVTLNGQALAQDEIGIGSGSITTEHGNIIIANWKFTCMHLSNDLKGQLMTFDVVYVDDKKVEDVGFSIRFQQTAPVSVLFIDGAESTIRTPHPVPPTEEPQHQHQHQHQHQDEFSAGLENELVELEMMKHELRALEHSIALKVQYIAENFDFKRPEELLSVSDCDSLKCIVKAVYHRVKGMASDFYGSNGFGDRHHGKPHWPFHHGKGRHGGRPPFFSPQFHGNHTHGNHTFPHRPPHFHPPPPFCHCPPPPHHGHGPPPRPHHHGDHMPPPPPEGPPPPYFDHEGRPPPHHGPPSAHHGPPPPHHGPPPPEFFGPGEFEDREPPHGPPHGPPQGPPHGPPHGPPFDDGMRPPPPPDMDEVESPLPMVEGGAPPPPPPPPHGHGWHQGHPPHPPPPHARPPFDLRHLLATAPVFHILVMVIVLILLSSALYTRCFSEKREQRRTRCNDLHHQCQGPGGAQQLTVKAKYAEFIRWLTESLRRQDMEDEEKEAIMRQLHRSDRQEDDNLSTTMEQEIAQFRVAADVVSDMVTAEEGRSYVYPGEVQQRHIPTPASPTMTLPAYATVDDVLPAYDQQDVDDSQYVVDGFGYTPGSSYTPSDLSGSSADLDEHLGRKQ